MPQGIYRLSAAVVTLWARLRWTPQFVLVVQVQLCARDLGFRWGFLMVLGHVSMGVG